MARKAGRGTWVGAIWSLCVFLCLCVWLYSYIQPGDIVNSSPATPWFLNNMERSAQIVRIQSGTGKEITNIIILEGAENIEIPAPLLLGARRAPVARGPGISLRVGFSRPVYPCFPLIRNARLRIGIGAFPCRFRNHQSPAQPPNRCWTSSTIFLVPSPPSPPYFT
jgi:hypothetical protein